MTLSSPISPADPVVSGELQTRCLQLEAELSRSRREGALLRRLADNARDMIYRMSLPDGRYEYVSPACLEMTGYAPQDFRTRDDLLRTLLHPDSQPYFERAWAKLLAGEMPPTYEYRIVHRDGSVRTFHQRNVLVTAADGRPTAIEGVVTDVTEQRRSADHERWMSRVLEDSLNEIYVADAETLRFLQVNRSARANLGYPDDLLYRMTPLELVPGMSASDFAALVAPLRREEREKQVLETRHLRSDGTSYPVEVHLQRMRMEGREVFVAIVIDISGRQRAKEERERLQSRLFQAEKLEALGTLAGGVAHDLNNMLTAILGFTQLAEDELQEDHPAATALQEVLRSSRRAKGLVEELLDFSRPHPRERLPLDLATLVRETVQTVEARRPDGIAVELDLPEDLPAVPGDRRQLGQVVMNLCWNAFAALEERGGRVALRLRAVERPSSPCRELMQLRDGPHVELRVEDDGPGMAPEVLRRALEPFFTTRAVGRGTGLGLAVVHGIVGSHGGEIEIESVEDEGTVVRVHLPIAATEDEETP